MPEPVSVKSVTPDQPRQGPAPQGRPRPAGARARPPVDSENAPVNELARKAELSLAEPDLGGSVHATV